MISSLIRSLSRRERIIFLGAAALFVMAFLGLLGFLVATKTNVIPAAGGEYTEGMVGQPSHVNPVTADTLVDTSLVRLLFAPITDLAETIEPSTDGRVWKVRLRNNLAWSDGTELTSDDVIFTVQTIQNPESGTALFGSWQGVMVNRVSQLELQFNLANPYAFFRDTLHGLSIVPKHIFADIPISNWRLSEYNLKPVGNGPYLFNSSRVRSDGFIESYNLSVNPHYANETPFIASFSFHFFTKMDEAIRAFNAGKIDGMINLLPEEQAQIERPYASLSFLLPNYYAVFLNQSTNLALQDPWVRKALDLVINRAQLVSQVFHGNADEAWGPIPQSMGNLAITGNATSSDPASLLETHGWKMASSTSREKRIGSAAVHLRIELSVPRIGFLEQTAELLKQAWSAIGVEVVLNHVSPDELSTVIKNRTYQAILFGNILHTSPDLFSFWHSSERFSPGLNLSLYSNKKADLLMESIRETSDETKRDDNLRSLQKLMVNDMPAFFLYSTRYFGAATKDLQGVDTSLIGDPADVFSGVAKWYLKTTRVIK